MSKHIAELSNAQLIEMVPAIGAEAPMQGLSDRYDFVQTVEAVDILRNAGWYPVEAKQSSVIDINRAGFQRHMVRFTRPGMDLQGERVDLLLYNSHDSGSAFRLLCSIWREICKNGLKHASHMLTFVHRHINFKPELFVESSMQIASQAGAVASQIESLKAIELMPEQRRELASLVIADVWKDVDSAPVTPDNLLAERRFDDYGNDLWTTFNVIQENVVKGGVKGFRTDKNGQVRQIKTSPIKSLQRDLRINQSIWGITESYAEKIAA